MCRQMGFGWLGVEQSAELRRCSLESASQFVGSLASENEAIACDKAGGWSLAEWLSACYASALV